MTNKEKKFELLFETLEGKRTGRKVSDHIKQVAKDIYLGTSSLHAALVRLLSVGFSF